MKMPHSVPLREVKKRMRVMMILRRTLVMIPTPVKRITVVMTSVATRALAKTGLTSRLRLRRMTATEMTMMTEEAEVGREAVAAVVGIATDCPTNLRRRVSIGPRRRKVDMETEIETGVTGRETAAVHPTRAPRRSPGVT